ncbi:hypothetical protein ACHAWF_014220 [Thalassiosira exigua]
MISNSVTNDRQRRASGPARIAPLGRGSISRQIEPIYREESDGDVEAAAQPPTASTCPTAPRPSKVMRSTRRKSSVNRTRDSIMRILKERETSNEEAAARSSLADTILSPVDWLLGPVDDIPPNENIHKAWESKRELDSHNPRPWYILLPYSRFRSAWDLFLACLLCLLAFYIPFRVCFFWEDEEEASSIFIGESVIDLLFAMDIALNFLTAYNDSETGILISHPKLIALRYIKGFFFVDLISTIPFGYILTQSPWAIANKFGKLGRLPKMIRFARAARLLKLLKVYKLQNFIMRLEIEYNVHHGVSRMIKIVMLIMLVTHLVGCFWFLIGLTGGDGDFGGWVFRYHLVASPKTTQYIASMYWAFSTLTTVGYGDISARTPQEQIYAMGMMLVGVSWYAYIVSSMSSIMSSFDAQNKAVRDKTHCVNEFIRAAKLPRDLSKQVRDFFEFKLARSQHAFLISNNYDADELLDELGSGLRADVLLYMDRHLISKIPFLQNKVPQFVADAISMFQPMVFQEGDFICKEGTQADEMFFLVKGKAGIYYGQKLIVVIEEGNYFGEIGCIMGGIRRAGVKALSTVELQALSRRNLNILLGEYPEVGEELKRVARDRASAAKNNGRSDSDKSSESESVAPLSLVHRSDETESGETSKVVQQVAGEEKHGLSESSESEVVAPVSLVHRTNK